MSTRTRSRLIVAKDPNELADVAAEWIAKQLEKTAKSRGFCTVALAGGSTPRPVYERLAGPGPGDRIPWEQVDFYFGDERAVPIDDPLSNYRMARETIGLTRPEALSRLHRMPADAPNPVQAAARKAILPPGMRSRLVTPAESCNSVVRVLRSGTRSASGGASPPAMAVRAGTPGWTISWGKGIARSCSYSL